MAEKSFNSPLMSQSNTLPVDFPRGSLLGSTKVVFHLGGRHVADIGEVHTHTRYIYIYIHIKYLYVCILYMYVYEYIHITYTYYIHIMYNIIRYCT